MINKNRIELFPDFIAIRNPDIADSQEKLSKYYSEITMRFLPKTSKNIESLEYAISDKIDNFFMTINNTMFKMKYKGIFNDYIDGFESFIFRHISSKDTLNIKVELCPTIVSEDDKKMVLSTLNRLKDLSDTYIDNANTLLSIDSYYMLQIKTSAEQIYSDTILN